MRGTTFLFVLLLLTATFTDAVADPPMQPGKWQITLHTVSPVDVPPMVTTMCVDKAHADKPEAPKVAPDDDCQVASQDFNGSVLSYSIRCKAKSVSSNAKFTYRGQSYSGTITITSGDVVITQEVDAVRLGECNGQ